MTVAVEVLGPVRLRVDGEERAIGGRRERLLLALLATTPGKHVGDDRLVDELWGDAPPTGVSSALQVAVSRCASRCRVAAAVPAAPSTSTHGCLSTPPHGRPNVVKGTPACANQAVRASPRGRSTS